MDIDMAEKLTVRYDRTGDILYIDKCRPYAAQASEELGDDVIARLKLIAKDPFLISSSSAEIGSVMRR